MKFVRFREGDQVRIGVVAAERFRVIRRYESEVADAGAAEHLEFLQRHAFIWPLSAACWALTTALFFAYWLPELFSALDALDTARTWKAVATDLRYLPFRWVVARAMGSARQRATVGWGIAAIVLFWTADGLVEAATGWSLGKVLHPHDPATADRLSGVFGSGNLKLGLIVCSLSPFALEALRERFGALGWLVGAVAIGTVVLLAGARAAWLGYALVLGISGRRALRSKAQLGAVVAIGLVVAGLGWSYSEQFRGRIERSVAVVSDTPGGADTASSGRMSLWLLGAVLAWRAWRWAPPEARVRARVPALALGVTVFPFNTHLAFYSNFWGGVFLLLLALFAGSLFAIEGDAPEGEPDAPAA
jgi:hypothetical protein